MVVINNISSLSSGTPADGTLVAYSSEILDKIVPLKQEVTIRL